MEPKFLEGLAELGKNGLLWEILSFTLTSRGSALPTGYVLWAVAAAKTQPSSLTIGESVERWSARETVSGTLIRKLSQPCQQSTTLKKISVSNEAPLPNLPQLVYQVWSTIPARSAQERGLYEFDRDLSGTGSALKCKVSVLGCAS